MTREEAKGYLTDLKHWKFVPDNLADEAIDMAIKALEQEPCEDATLKDIFCMGCEYKEQEPKTGHWILTDDDFVYCSECEDSYYPRPIDASWYYCPNCGAKMVEPQESEDKE